LPAQTLEVIGLKWTPFAVGDCDMSELDPRAECAFDEIVERFETAWNEGHEPEIDDYLPEDESRDELLEHLVHIDLEYRVKAGYSTRAQDYLDRYPELSRDEKRQMNC